MDESHSPPGERSQDARLPVTPQNQHSNAEVGDGSQLLPINLENDSVSTPNQAQAPPIRRGRGRPRGSKNKKTLAAENALRQPQRRFPSPAAALGDERDNRQSWMGDEYIPSDYGGSPYRAIDRSQLGRENDLAAPEPYESRAVADFIESYRSSVHLAREKNRQSATVSRERIREEELYELAKLIDSHTWSQAQEDELVVSWESGLVNAAIIRLPDRGTYLSSVFEISFHLCNMDPLSLISMYHEFEFDNSGSDSFMHGGRMKRNPLWTETNGYRFLPIVIRWAVICRADDGEGFSTEEARILSHLGCGNLDQFSGSSVLRRFRVHQEQFKASGIPITRYAKLLLLIADLVGMRAVPTSADIIPVRTGDLSVVISALDSLDNYGLKNSCDFHHLKYCASQTSTSHASGLDELLEAYKGAWMKLQRRRLCNAAVNQPPIQGDKLYHQAARQGVPADTNFPPKAAIWSGFSGNAQPAEHFQRENSPLRPPFGSNADDSTGTIVDHRDGFNPFQAFLTNQPSRAQSNLRSPFIAQLDPSTSQESRMGCSEDGETTAIESSDEDMMEDRPEQVRSGPKAAGGRPRKRKGEKNGSRDRVQKRQFQTKKQKKHRPGHGGQTHSSASQRQGGSQGGAWHVVGNQKQPDPPINPPAGPKAWREQQGGHGTF
ncbi:hypothetical protein J7337_006536 [Fusarium musae]|uniref:Uncharacterized protein n=1 Tax=Fusarium musae TaxID=1042133 RepID=A0A9P8IPH0_9HYPO|nr:hypothetical protein J7337_006536 [Fusarium musae]KAG9500855.1 hypothetical protein J7337_006536 [Fusarium musae]